MEAKAISDQTYLEGYFDICRILRKKQLLIGKLNRKAEVQDKADTENAKPEDADGDTIRQEIKQLNEEISRRDRGFWADIAAYDPEGKNLGLEKIAQHYKLSIAEKRIILFLLYLQQNHFNANVCPGNDLVATFDTSDSIVERMRLARCLASSNTLVKEKFIDRNYLDDNVTHDLGYYLLKNALYRISRAVDGDNEFYKDTTGVSADIEEIGYVKIPQRKLNQVVLPEEAKEKIIFFLDDYAVLDSRNQTVGKKGISFLFYGAPGTGKTMTAEAIAMHLGKSLLIVDVSKIESMWAGEAEKNIVKMFKAARDNDMVLCLDEADSLLFSRTMAMRDHSTRTVNVMLQEIERFCGVVVLTTNMDQIIDPAIERRISLRVKFENPDKLLQEKIWQVNIPLEIKTLSDINFSLLVQRYDLSGGYIKNAIENALRRMKQQKRQALGMDDLIFGAEMEKEGLFNKKNQRTIDGFSKW